MVRLEITEKTVVDQFGRRKGQGRKRKRERGRERGE
jgi:hypothetical protein